MTVVLPVKSCLPPDLSGGTGTIGIRYPDHAVAQAIIAGLDSPITDYLIDGGKLPGTPSTVINLATKKIERPGAMLEEIASFLKEEL